jgi:hypothetical protein
MQERTCAACDYPLDDNAIQVTIGGRTVEACCEECAQKLREAGEAARSPGAPRIPCFAPCDAATGAAAHDRDVAEKFLNLSVHYSGRVARACRYCARRLRTVRLSAGHK